MKLRQLVCALALLSLVPNAGAETASPGEEIRPLVRIDGFDLTNLHFSIFAAQQGESTDTQAQQMRLLNELVNSFMIARSAEGRAMAENPELKAAMEVANARLLARAVINDAVERIAVSDEQIEKAYLERYAESGRQEYKARHILLESEAAATAVIAELVSGGDFQTLARERSTGPSSSAGGDLGWFTPDSMVKPFATAVLAMQDGEYSRSPVKTRFGWHVILRENSRELPAPTREDVHDDIVDELKTEQLSRFVKGLRNKAEIEVIGADTPR